MISSRFTNKEILFLKGYLKGKGFNNALKAINLAETAHFDAKRKSGEPFISHPIRIANALVSLGVEDENILIISILHDILEDTYISREELLDIFDEKIVCSIELLTKQEGITLKCYYENIQLNPEASIVKIADRCHNVSTMYFFDETKTKMYIEETEKYIIPLCSFVSNKYPELSNYAYYMKYHIESIIETTKHFMNNKKNCY